jgi:hypothetical protein
MGKRAWLLDVPEAMTCSPILLLSWRRSSLRRLR